MRQLLTELDDRKLRYDGVSIVHPDNVAFLMCHGIQPEYIQVTKQDPQIDQFNDQVSEAEAIRVFDVNDPFTVDMDWNVPKKYLDIDLSQYIIDIFEQRIQTLKYSDDELEKASLRIGDELAEIDKRGMGNFMRTVIYILDKLKQNDQVWGVGRGSSCACYILFLLDLHKVDCIRMDVPLEEFFHN